MSVMSIALDIVMWLMIETILGFILYSTGCAILNVFTFGQFKADIKDYMSFKANKAKNVYLICLLGFSFYAALIGFVAYISQ
ncbi:hypothetical protein PAT01_02370 [Pseudoalteromonas atlantica]|uniref:Uncharacterized protein n=2 Tax=Pseudoalteromonas TaxID=53246 RepID=A0ABQ0U8X2_PSEAF|nr:hypothetical protein PAT01_02370 [Pseudoalteromonas atlantica]|tara:strand:+ start:203 stop:448 length:246 start_codon:yes stop_codon:yes gene_type:complete